MHVTLGTLLAALPLLAAAAPPQQTNRGYKISLSKRSLGLTNSDGTVNITSLRSSLSRATGKIQSGLTAFRKNTGQVHPFAPNETFVQTRNSGSDPLVDEGDGLMWQGKISVGTPPVTYSVDFDTGSSDLFLPGPDCTNSACSGHTVYNPSSSSTSKDIGKTFSLQYGDGSTVAGEQFTDTVTIGGLTATGQTLGVAKQYSDGFSSDRFSADGLMGMAFKSLSDYNANPVFQSLVAQGKTDDAVFAFKLSSNGSELSLGTVNNGLFTGDITYTPVTQEGYWQVEVDSASVNGKTAVSGIPAIIDTGTTLIVGDPTSVATFYKAVPGAQDASSTLGAGLFTIPCDSIPTVSLAFSGQSFDISPDVFNLGTVSDGSSDCVGGIMGAQGQDFWIVGDIFLQNVYTVFDVGKSQVGFAQLA